MIEEAEYCSCPGARTKDIIKKNKNKCPNTDCGKKMTDIQGYDTEEATGEPTRNEHQFKIFADWLEGLSTGQLKGNRAIKDQSQNAIKIKLPTFTGAEDPNHFFVKIKNYFEIQNIRTRREKARILKSCLSDDALDFYLSMEDSEQTDIDCLEKAFKRYFKPVKHDLIETERFLKIKKRKEQSASNFYTQIKRKGLELLIDPVLIKQAFCQGLDNANMRHCAL